MAKQDQVLIIEPQTELKFRGPFTSPVTSYLRLKNPTENIVCFKIKTTAPKKYCVRPNSGIISPQSHIIVAVSLQPFDFDPNEKNKHKFMVQTMIASDRDVNLDTLWKDVNPDNLMDSKLKCVFEMPVESTGVNSPASDVGSTIESPRVIGDAPNINHDGELVKAAKEVKTLREEESSLRQENLQLKEELIRLRAASNASSHPAPPSTPALTSWRPTSFVFVVAAVAIAIFGILLGKYLL